MKVVLERLYQLTVSEIVQELQDDSQTAYDDLADKLQNAVDQMPQTFIIKPQLLLEEVMFIFSQRFTVN
jgi:hypothetical protein